MDAASIGAVLAVVGSAVYNVFMLRRRQRESDATAAKGLAEAEKLEADADAVTVASALALNSGLLAEIERQRNDISELREESQQSRRRETTCRQSLEIMRAAMIQHGIPVPPLPDLDGHPPAHHPMRRRTDYLPDTNEGEPQ